MIAADRLRQLPALASEAVAQAADLVQLEFRLARVELMERALAWRTGLVLGAVAVIFAAAALILVVEACVAALIQAGLSPAVATIIVAGACALVALVFFLTSRKKLDFDELKPRRTITEVNRDKEMVKEKLT